MKHFIALLTAAAVLATASCGSDKEHKAAAALSAKADSLMKAGNFEAAIELYDSLNHAYPKEIDLRKASDAKRARAIEGLAQSQAPLLDRVIDSLNSVIAGLYPDFNREQSSSALNAYAVHKSLAGQKTVGTAALQPRINIEGNDVSDTPWSIAVFAPSNIGLSSVNVTTASGQSFTLDAFSNDGQVGSIVTSVAEPLGKYLSEHPDDPATAFTLNGKKGKAQGKLTPAFSTATAASYNYALAKQQLRSTLINREKIERRIVIAREQAAKAAAPAVSTTEK
ncbi:MAG: hypothetical protein ACI4US_03005 [Muribaculaceae bacterium]